MPSERNERVVAGAQPIGGCALFGEELLVDKASAHGEAGIVQGEERYGAAPNLVRKDSHVAPFPLSGAMRPRDDAQEAIG